nr:class I SAM-dependent methyltransferase [uncultured Rhodopila sp.]
MVRAAREQGHLFDMAIGAPTTRLAMPARTGIGGRHALYAFGPTTTRERTLQATPDTREATGADARLSGRAASSCRWRGGLAAPGANDMRPELQEDPEMSCAASMKICDGADWFSSDLSSLISHELHDVPAFNRKQWEFAMILRALSEAGALRFDSTGISFGAGQERPLYAIANRVRQIWATDLYSSDTAWPTARKDNARDLTDFVRAGSPFATISERISAKSMDMRAIEFPDDSFDFAYSSSAVEHIGEWSDFSAHLAEVRRVLKPGGVYVLTTDITFGPNSEHPGNFKFSPAGLEWWLQSSGMAYEPVVDCRIAHHYVNTPLPPDIACYFAPGGGETHLNLAGTNIGLFGKLSTVHCLAGCEPHTSVLLILKKAAVSCGAVEFPGFHETRDFLLSARGMIGRMLEDSTLCPQPNPWIPDGMKPDAWATSYMWLGEKHRMVRVNIEVDQPGSVTIGVNKAQADRYWEPLVEMVESVHLIEKEAEFEFPLFCDNSHTFAIYGRALPGTRLKHVNVILDDSRTYSQAAMKIEPAAEFIMTPAARRQVPTSPASSLLKRTAKAALIRLPEIRALWLDRNRLRDEADRLRHEADRLVLRLANQKRFVRLEGPGRPGQY